MGEFMRRLVFGLLLLTIGWPCALAQQPEQQAAEQRLRELQTQISRFEEQLTVTRSDETRAVEALTTIDREIATREALIDSYASRLSQLNNETIAIENEMDRSQRDLNRLRAEYASYARHAYMRGRVGDLALILSAGSINEMLVRARYLQRFSNQRQRAAQQIVLAQQDLRARRVRLDSTAAEVEVLLSASRIEQAQLATRQRERTQMVTQLRQRRSSLQAEVRRRENEAGQLRNQIQQMIAEADAERRRAAEAERRRADEAAALAARPASNANADAAGSAPATSAPAPASEVSEAEFTRLSGSFRENRGRLPWPVSGVVTEAFGPRRNAVTGTTITNPGMVISTSPNAPVRAVFGGAVSRIWFIGGYGLCTMISHGDFATVYCNLADANVRQGQRIEAGAVIGQAGQPGEQPLGAGILFGLFENGRERDPADWLSRR